MTARGRGIEIEGIKELQKGLRDLGGKEMAKNLKQGSLAAATVVADEANKKLARHGRLGAKLARSKAIRPAGGQRDAKINLGGARPKVKQAMAAMEYGAKRKRYRFSGRWVGNQHIQPIGSSGRGRFVAWAAHRKSAEAVAAWEDVLDRIIDRAIEGQ